jgi:hypothetical protein
MEVSGWIMMRIARKIASTPTPRTPSVRKILPPRGSA